MSESAYDRTHALAVTRLPSASQQDEEAALAEHVERWIRQVDGCDLGNHTGRDGDPGVRVDFLYDGAATPIALEITSIQDGPVRALGAELIKLEAELDELASREQLGSWMIGIRTGSRVATLRAPLEQFLRQQGQRSSEPAQYSVENAPPDLPRGDLRVLVRLLEEGLVTALRVGDGHGVSIFPPVATTGLESGFSTLLRHAIADNGAKLDETRPRETHLLVALGVQVSGDPDQTPPPTLPDSIDVLWVNLGYWNAKHDYRLWRTTRADLRWQLLDHPLGQPPRWHPPRTD